MYNKPVERDLEQESAIKNRLDYWHTKMPYLGVRKLRDRLQNEDGMKVGRKLIKRYVDKMGIYAVYPKPNLSKRNQQHMGRFDFVVYERISKDKQIPVLAIELDGKEHFDNETVMERDRKKQEICHTHGFELIRIENTYNSLSRTGSCLAIPQGECQHIAQGDSQHIAQGDSQKMARLRKTSFCRMA